MILQRTLYNEELRSVHGSSKFEREHDLELNKVDMTNPDLQLGVKFTNTIVFRAMLREHVVRRSIVMKFMLNKYYKISAIYKNECKWPIYASKILNELTF